MTTKPETPKYTEADYEAARARYRSEASYLASKVREVAVAKRALKSAKADLKEGEADYFEAEWKLDGIAKALGRDWFEEMQADLRD